jgi:hypothetical protein
VNRSYAMVATALGAGVGTIAAVAAPAAAHEVSVASPAGVGAAAVGSTHHGWAVCTINNVHSVRGEFKRVDGSVFTATASPIGNPNGNCVSNHSAYEIVSLRACDPRGCTDWKST